MIALSDLQMMAEVGELKGLLPGIPDSVYHSKECPGYSSSFLKKVVSQTPAHALASLDDHKDSDALIFGRAVHSCLLEPEKFGELFTFAPEGMRRDPRSKDYQAFLATAGGKTILTFDQYRSVMQIRKSFLAHPLAKLVEGKIEHSGFWRDEETGLYCKVRPDVLRDDGLVFDLKTTQSASDWSFSRSVYDFGYHVSAAMYLRGLSEIMGIELKKFVLVAIEKEPPYGIQFFDLDAAAIKIGEQEFRKALNIVKQCKETGVWPGYPEQFQVISLPNFAMGA